MKQVQFTTADDVTEIYTSFDTVLFKLIFDRFYIRFVLNLNIQTSYVLVSTNSHIHVGRVCNVLSFYETVPLQCRL